MTNLIRYYDNAIPDDLIQQCLSYSNLSNLGRIDHDGVSLYCEYLSKYDMTLCKSLGNIIVNFFEQYRKDVPQTEYLADVAIKDFSLKKYLPEDRFSLHCDVTNLETSTRSLGVILYLNEDSGTRFPYENNMVIESKPGRILFFPPYWTHPHEGLPAKREKNIITTYLHLYKNTSNWGSTPH